MLKEYFIVVKPLQMHCIPFGSCSLISVSRACKWSKASNINRFGDSHYSNDCTAWKILRKNIGAKAKFWKLNKAIVSVGAGDGAGAAVVVTMPS